jgi:hypothetical protein
MSAAASPVSALPMTVHYVENLGELGAVLEDHLGPGVEAILVLRRKDATRLSRTRGLPQPEHVIRPVARRVLDMARVPGHLKGRALMEDALCMLAADYPARPPLHGDVYVRLGARHGIPVAAVERDIRHALAAALRAGGETAGAILGLQERGGNGRALYSLLALIQTDLGQ